MNVKTVDIVKPKAVNTHIKKKIIQILVVAEMWLVQEQKKPKSAGK